MKSFNHVVQFHRRDALQGSRAEDREKLRGRLVRTVLDGCHKGGLCGLACCRSSADEAMTFALAGSNRVSQADETAWAIRYSAGNFPGRAVSAGTRARSGGVPLGRGFHHGDTEARRRIG